VAIVPIYANHDDRTRVLAVASKLHDACVDAGIRARLDDRDQHRPGFKFSDWEMKGVPVRIEIGPKDVDAATAVLVARTGGGKHSVPVDDVATRTGGLLDEVQAALVAEARDLRERNTHEAGDYTTLRSGLVDQGGFWVSAWCGDHTCEQRVTDDTRATIRVLPLETEEPGAVCAVCGRPGTERATWGRAY
jgi:prolyl-tRNA synthetase